MYAANQTDHVETVQALLAVPGIHDINMKDNVKETKLMIL